MRSTTTLVACIVAAGCGDDGATPPDSRVIDAPLVDAPVDARPVRPPPTVDPPGTVAMIASCALRGLDCGNLTVSYVDAGGVLRVLRRTGATWSRIDVTAGAHLEANAEQAEPVRSHGSPLAWIVRFSDGSLTFVHRDNGSWEHKDISYDTLAPAARPGFATTASRSRTRVLFTGTDDALHELRGDAANFFAHGRLAATGPAGGLTSVYDGQVLYAAPGGVPTLVDWPTDIPRFRTLTGPAMVGRGALGYMEAGYEGIVYRDAAGAIHVANPAGAVHALAIGAPAATGDLSAAENRSLPIRLAVGYRTAAGAPIVLERTGAAAWTYTDVRAAGPAPAAAGPVAVGYEGTTLHLAYATADQHIHLVSRTDATWVDVDLTATVP